jgi:4-amino-4-deoxy-L-arabinose transferase-like glycosyltransferase
VALSRGKDDCERRLTALVGEVGQIEAVGTAQQLAALGPEIGSGSGSTFLVVTPERLYFAQWNRPEWPHREIHFDEISSWADGVQYGRYALVLNHPPKDGLEEVIAHHFLWFHWGNVEREVTRTQTIFRFSRKDTKVATAIRKALALHNVRHETVLFPERSRHERRGSGIAALYAKSTNTTPQGMNLPGFAWPLVAAWAAAAVALLLLTATRDGYHRDELYFLEASHHLAWGYVDQPPLSIALAGLSRLFFGNSLLGMRLFPALADGAVVIFTGLIARELGGERFSQGLASLAIAVSPFLIAGHLAGPTIYDFLAWVVVSFLVIRILRTGNERLWLLVGVTVGVALENKETILFLLFGLFIGLIVNRQIRLLASVWLGIAVLGALALWAPNLIWQAQHSWPSLEMSKNLHQEHSGLTYTFTFVPIQLLLPGWWIAPVWMAGLWALWREPWFRRYRAFALAYSLLFVLVGLFMGDRPYYFAALYAVAVTAGAIVADEVIQGLRRFFPRRRPRRRLIWGSRRTVVVLILVIALINLPLSLPILPASALAKVPLQNLNYNLGETIGWRQLVSRVARVPLAGR